MVSTFSHNSTEPSRSDVGSSIQELSFISSRGVPPVRALSLPVNQLGLFVHLIQRGVRGAKALSVIHSVAIDMVNHVRLFAVGKKEAKPMHHVADALVLNPEITTPCGISGDASFSDLGPAVNQQ